MPPRRTLQSSARESKASRGKVEESIPSASWSDNDVDFLIDQIARRAEAGDGMIFKRSFWQSVADSLELARPAKGGPKSRTACQEKWSRLKKTFEAVDHLAHSSGFVYSLQLGANVGVESVTVWNEFLKHHPAAAPFKNKGWPFYEKIKLIIPSSKTRGARRFSVHGPAVPGPSSITQRSVDTLAAAAPSAGGAHEDEASGERSTDMAVEPSATRPLSGNDYVALMPPSSSKASGSSAFSTSLSLDHGALSTSSHFTPPTAPFSYTGSLASSIKPSSSISARAESSNKRKAEDDDISMVSATSHSVVGSSCSSAQKRRTGLVASAIDRMGDQLRSLNDTFREGVAQQSADPINIEATKRLLSLDLNALAPEQMVTIIDCFQENIKYAEMYLTLATDTSPPYTTVRIAWLRKRLEEAGVQHGQH